MSARSTPINERDTDEHRFSQIFICVHPRSSASHFLRRINNDATNHGDEALNTILVNYPSLPTRFGKLYACTGYFVYPQVIIP